METDAIEEASTLGRSLGVVLDASAAHERALACCIAPFSARGYRNYALGDATQQTLREIWNGDAYRDFRGRRLSDAPPKPCEGCGLRWSL